jgi:hypothetical protein
MIDLNRPEYARLYDVKQLLSSPMYQYVHILHRQLVLMDSGLFFRVQGENDEPDCNSKLNSNYLRDWLGP